VGATQTEIFDDLTALSDATRSRMLLLLERQELTVTDLCAVLQLPQSTVSRHLKTLSDASWVVSRRDGRAGTIRSRWTSAARAAARCPARAIERDAWRRSGRPSLRGVLARRQTKSAQFFDSAAGQWDKLRAELFGPSSHLQALPALLDHRWIVGDLGCGTGQVAAAIAPFVERVIAVDRSGDMLQAARRRLRNTENVEVRRGELEALPVADGELNAATLLLVLHHLPDPAAALSETARVLRQGGRLLIADMLPHDHEEYRQQMGHVWLGFSEEQLRRLLGSAGFDAIRVVPMAPPPETKGPALFVASCRRA
jgi:ArsR family transcriptional regulator